MKKLGIVAGNGALPNSLIQECLAKKRPFFVLALKGHADPALLPDGIPMKWIRLGDVGSAFAEMKKQKVSEIVLIGGVRRPGLLELCPDWRGMKFFTKIGLKALGDDGLLRAVIREIESEGFRVIGVDEILPSLLAQKGVFGSVSPAKEDWLDIEHGFQVADVLGQADVGQAVVVQQGLVLAVEAIEGTKALIERAGFLKRKGSGGVLVKTAKPQQDHRVDLPTIGPDTVQSVFNAGLRGIAVQSGGVLVAEIEKTVLLANQLGIFIVGVDHE